MDRDEERETGGGRKEAERKKEEEAAWKEGGNAVGCWSGFFCGITVVSGFLLMCTMGITYTFGNFTPYMTSYLRNVTQEPVDYTDTLWIFQTGVITACIAMPISGALSTLLPLKVLMFIGVLMNAVATFGSYWAVSSSFWPVWFTYGVLGGLPLPFLYPSTVTICSQWVPHRRGLVTGIILMGFGVGSFGWNALITWYINRDNLKPGLKVADDLYYTQSAVLDKVPSSFLVLGTVSVSIQIISLLLIRLPSPRQTQEITVSLTAQNEEEGTAVATSTVSFRKGKETEPLLSNGVDHHHDHPHHQKKKTMTEGQAEVCNVTGVEEGETTVMTWKQILKCQVFWTIWMQSISILFGVAFITNLFKAYGQTFIADDHFLTSAAMAGSICNGVGRPIGGLLADKFGPRILLLVAQCFLAILVVTFSSCEVTGRVAFFLWVGAMFLCISIVFVCIPLLLMVAFGAQNFNISIGMSDTSGVLGALIPAIVASPVKAAFGWHGLFFVEFGALLVGIVLNMSLDCFRCGTKLPRTVLSQLSLQS